MAKKMNKTPKIDKTFIKIAVIIIVGIFVLIVISAIMDNSMNYDDYLENDDLSFETEFENEAQRDISDDEVESDDVLNPSPTTTIKNSEALEVTQDCSNYEQKYEDFLGSSNWSEYTIQGVYFSPIESTCIVSVYAIADDNTSNLPRVAFIIYKADSQDLLFYRDTSNLRNESLVDLSDIHINAVKYLRGIEDLKYSRYKWN